jgi:hypothetical protein
VETIAAPCEVGSAPVGLNVDVPRYEHERPEEYRHANYQARDRVELDGRLMSFSPMSHGAFPLMSKRQGEGLRFHDDSVPKSRIRQ